MWRAIAVLALAGILGGMLAAGPAVAGKFLTKKKALKLFYTKGQAEARFLDVAEGDARFLNSGEALSGTVFYRRSASIPVNNGTATWGTAECPAGTEAVGGGAWTSNPFDTPITGSAPAGPTTGTVFNAWTAFVRNNSGSPQTFRVYVICVDASAINADYAAGGPLP